MTAEVQAASTHPRCTNDGEYAYLTGEGASRYWHTIEDWNFDPDNVPKQQCQNNPSDGTNTVGFREYDNANFVAYACSFSATTARSSHRAMSTRCTST